MVSSPTLAGGGQLNAVVAVSSTDVWAVASLVDPNTEVTSTVIEQWDGAAWNAVASPSPSASQNTLNGAVADPSSDQAWAVGGFFDTTMSQGQALVEFTQQAMEEAGLTEAKRSLFPKAASHARCGKEATRKASVVA